jgi:hypothetical protein
MPSPTTFSIIIAIILASIVVVSKLRKTLRGSKVRQKPLIAITLVQLGLTSYFVLSSLFIGIPIIFLILYAILFILAQFISYRYSHSSSPIVTQIGYSHFGGLLMDQYFGRVDYISTLSTLYLLLYVQPSPFSS